MKVNSISDDGKTILLEVGDGAIVAVHSHTNGECEIQFAGVEGPVTITAPPFKKDPLETLNMVFARYTVRKKDN